MRETNLNGAFYVHLAELFYAMGMADKRFSVEEKRSILSIIRKNWMPGNTDLDVEKIMYTQLKTLVDSEVNSEAAFEQFKYYYDANTATFTLEIRKQILENIYLIASSFSKRNKSELVFFSRVVNLFFPST